MSGRTYVLIHGAWFGGWVWQDVAKRLRAMGHDVYAPSLTGLGDRRHLLRPDINLDTHTDDIVNLLVEENLHDVVLVGWSYGGMVASNVLARSRDRVASIVYLDAFIPEPGRSMVSYVFPDEEIRNLQAMADRGMHQAPMDLGFMIDSPAIISHAQSRISEQPIASILQPSKALPVRPEIPHSFILANQFQGPVFRPFFERFEAENWGDAYAVEANHCMMLTNPDETAEILASVR